jgi:hypothetical protein
MSYLVAWYDFDDKMVRCDGPYGTLEEAKADYGPEEPEGHEGLSICFYIDTETAEVTPEGGDHE